ncbi:reverse transcriptase domain-containing protein, partial [Tanacetum coccineum]
MLSKKLPEKCLGDIAEFLIPCNFPGMDVRHALADLGASINLMPLSIWKKAFSAGSYTNSDDFRVATDRYSSLKSLEDIFIKVGNFHFPTDFVVVDFEADPRVPLILERSFLRNSRALIDVYKGELVLRDGIKQITFHVNGTSKHPQKHVLEDIECKVSYDSNLDESTFLVTPLSNSNKDECLTPGDDIEILLYHDPSTPMKSVASILEGFINDPLFEENDDLFDLECKTNDWKRILYDASTDEAECFDPGGNNDEIDAFLAIEVPTYIEGYYDSEGDHRGIMIFYSTSIARATPPRLSPHVISIFHALHHQSPKNFHIIIESLPISTTLIEDCDSNREEIEIFSGPDDSIPPGIESDFNSEEDIIDNLLNNDSTHERLTFSIEPDVPVINNVDELNKDECFDPGGGEIDVEVDNSFIFVTLIFLTYLTYPEVSPLLSSTKNE